jgi:transposase InsO family protein
MPWKSTLVEEQRWRFLQEALHTSSGGFAALCRRFGISRKCGYKWRHRLSRLGRAGLADGSRRPRAFAHAYAARWRQQVLALQAAHYGVGARKLHALLRRLHRDQPVPAERTLQRWLQAAGRTRAPRRWARPGPWQRRPVARHARRPNEVWTVDFKGWFRTGDGTRMQVLTVRDLASRYLLATTHLAHVDERNVRRCLARLFRRHGWPQAIRVDRGAPFCGDGPRHWSRLSVEWRQRGIAVQISRRARPQDNAAHEQMHRVLKADTASPPARTLAAQRRRLERWRRWYNEQRPHEALRQQPPATHYRSQPRGVPPLRPLRYPARWSSLRVDRRGYIYWRGQRWQIGRAFHGCHLGLRPRPGHHQVYFGPDLLGTLHPGEHLLRPVRLYR